MGGKLLFPYSPRFGFAFSTAIPTFGTCGRVIFFIFLTTPRTLTFHNNYILKLRLHSLGYRLLRSSVVTSEEIHGFFSTAPHSPLAPNVVAASRRRGLHKSSGGRHTCKFVQKFGRAYAPACVKPLVSGWRYSILFFFKNLSL